MLLLNRKRRKGQKKIEEKDQTDEAVEVCSEITIEKKRKRKKKKKSDSENDE